MCKVYIFGEMKVKNPKFIKSLQLKLKENKKNTKKANFKGQKISKAYFVRFLGQWSFMKNYF